MPDRVIFNIAIPWTDEFTGIVHPLAKLREWFFRTADLPICKGGSVIGVGLFGVWYDKDRPPEENPLEDYSNWYKFGVLPDKVEELRRHIEGAAQEFGQKSMYFERAGEVDFVVNPTLPPSEPPVES